jgi:hypothetical protein
LREFVAALETALQRVPLKYRAVLRGHLGDGKKPKQLAQELGASPGTVRVQLHRGLALLRKLLPASFALGLVTSLAPRGHAALRESILHHARLVGCAKGASTSLILGGVLVNSKLVFLCLSVLGALSLVPWFMRSAPALPAPTSLSAITRSAAEPPASIEPAPFAHSRSSVENVFPEPLSADDPYGALDIAVVWHDGSPAADVELELTPRGDGHIFSLLRTSVLIVVITVSVVP